MQFSTLSRYGVRAMADLALHEGQGPIPVAAVAKRQGIPLAVLAQLLHRLRQAGLVVAARGARGGYQVARPTARITVADIVRLFEAQHPRRPRAARRPLASDVAVDQAAALVWGRIETAITTALATTTLAELVAEARRRDTHHTVQHTYTFHI